MAVDLKLNIDSNAAFVAKDLDSVAKAVGLTTPQLKQMAAGWKSNREETEGFTGAVNQLTAKLGGITGAIKGVAAAFSVGLSFNKLEQAAVSYNKTLFDLSRSTKVIGGDYKSLSKGIDELNKSTFMSKQQAAEFTLNLQKNVQGTRLSSQEITKLGQVLTSEYCGAIEDINKATNELMGLQKKNINLFKDLGNTMSDGAFADYLSTMEVVYGASEDQIDATVRMRTAFQANGNQLTKQEQEMLSLGNSMQDAKKSAADLENAMGQQLVAEFKTMNKFMADTTRWVTDLTNRFPFLTKAIAVAAVAIGSLAVAGTALIAGKGILSLGKGLLGGGKAAAGLAGLGGGGGGGGKAGGFLSGLVGGGQLGTQANPMHVVMGSVAGGNNPMGNGRSGQSSTAGAGRNLMGVADGMAAAMATGMAAYGAYSVLSDDKAYNENLKGQAYNKDGSEKSAIGNAMDTLFGGPEKWGKQIATFDVLLKDLAKDWVGLGDKIGGHKDVVAASKMSNKDFKAHLQKQQADFSKEHPEQVAMAAAAEKKAKSDQNEITARQDINRHYQMQKMLAESITQTAQAQIEYALKYENDVAAALGWIEKQRSALDLTLSSAEKLLEITMQNKTAAEKQLKTDEDAARAKLTGEELEKALVSIYERRQALIAKEAVQHQNITQAKTQHRGLDMLAITSLDHRRSLIESQVGLAESELQLNQQLYMGLGPTIESQMKIVDLMENQIALIEEQLATAEQTVAEGKGTIEIEKKIYQLRLQKNQAVSKEIEMTKNLREGYLDAMGAFTNIEGSFAKIITKREQGMGELIRQFGVQGGAKTGAGGAGTNSPMASWQAGGKFEFAGTAAMNKNADTYGINEPIVRNRVGAAQASKASGTDDFFAAAGAGMTSVKTEAETEIAKRINSGQASGPKLIDSVPGGASPTAGAGPNANLINVAKDDPTVAAILTLDKNMPDHVMNGVIKASGADLLGVKAGGSTVPMAKPDGLKTTPAAAAAAAAATTPAAAAAAAAAAAKNENKGLAFGATGNAADIARGKAEHASPEQITQAIEKLNKQISETENKIKSGPGDANKNAASLAKDQDDRRRLMALQQQDQLVAKKQANLEAAKKSMETNRPMPSQNMGTSKEDKAARMAKIAEMPKKAAEARAAKDKMLLDSLQGRMDARKEEIATSAQINAERKKKELAQKIAASKDAKTKEALQKQFASVTPEQTTGGLDKLKQDIEVQQKKAAASQAAAEKFKEKAPDAKVPQAIKEADYAKNMGISGGLVENKTKQQMQDEGAVATAAFLKSNKEQIKALTASTQAYENQRTATQDVINVSEMWGASMKKDMLRAQQAAMAPITEMAKIAEEGDFEAPSPSDPVYAASGGFIPGTGDKDSVPAMLMPGEFVMNKESSKRYGWLLERLNANKYADGGFVGGLASMPSAATAMAGGGGGGGFSPNISINAKGDSINKITKMVTNQLSSQLNKMMTPSGSSGRFFDATQ